MFLINYDIRITYLGSYIKLSIFFCKKSIVFFNIYKSLKLLKKKSKISIANKKAYSFEIF